jgi:hypothetical protein
MLTGRKLALTLAFTVLVALAFGVSCKGFFVKPTVTAITIGPTGQTVGPSGTLQFVASGTMSDGSPNQIVTNQCLWSSSNSAAGTIGPNNGLFTAVSVSNLTNPPQQSTITAAFQALTPATATVSVCPAVTSLSVSASPTTFTHGQSVQITFTATATFATGGGNQTVTNEVTWNISDTTVIPSITNGVATTGTGATAGEAATVTATLCGVNSNNSVTITAQ